MKKSFSLWAAGAVTAAACAGQPVFASTGDVPREITGFGGSMSIVFSEQLLGALMAGYVDITGLGATLDNWNDETGMLTIDTRVESGKFLYDDASHSISTQSIHAEGGILLNIQRFRAKRGAGDSPGWLTLSNLEIDFAAKAVYADVAGDHGVGMNLRQHMWNFDSVESSLGDPRGGGVMVNHDQIRGLTITDTGLDLLVQGLSFGGSFGSTATGRMVLGNIEDHGSIFSAARVPVPEPSAWAMMALGLAGLAVAGRGRRSSH